MRIMAKGLGRAIINENKMAGKFIQNSINANMVSGNVIVKNIDPGLPIGARAASSVAGLAPAATTRSLAAGTIDPVLSAAAGGAGSAAAMPAAGLVGSPVGDTAGRIAGATNTYWGGVRDVGGDIKRGARSLWEKTRDYYTGADIEGAADFRRQMGSRYAIAGGAVAGSLAAIGLMNSSEDRRMQRNVQRATGGYGY